MPFGLVAPRFLPLPLIASFAVLESAMAVWRCQLSVFKARQECRSGALRDQNWCCT